MGETLKRPEAARSPDGAINVEYDTPDKPVQASHRPRSESDGIAHAASAMHSA